MNNMAIISDILTVPKDILDSVSLFYWTKADLPYLGDFEILVVDSEINSIMDFDVKMTDPSWKTMEERNSLIMENMRRVQQYEKTLDAGCVIIFLMSKNKVIKPFSRTSTCLLNQKADPCFRSADNFKVISERQGTHFDILEKKRPYIYYFEYVDSFEKILTGNIEPIAVTHGSREVISGMIRVGNGALVLLPHYKQGAKFRYSSEDWSNLTSILRDIGKMYLKDEEQQEEEIDRPHWIESYWADVEKECESQYVEIREKQRKFRVIDTLLWGKGTGLEKAVCETLSGLGLRVERTKPGESVDLYAFDDKFGIVFAIEVTGTNGYIGASHKKVAQISRFIIQERKHEKAILIANTHCEAEPNRRAQGFTDKVVQYAESNGIGLVNSADLHALWRKVNDRKLNYEDFIHLLENTSGLLGLSKTGI